MKLKRPEGIAAHPAEYSVQVLEAIREIVPSGAIVLDHMAGTGWRLATALDDCEVIGIELEPEWADAHPCVRQGDALDLPFPDESIHWVVNSPSYGNRMADHHDAKERCKSCGGTGLVDHEVDEFVVDRDCPKCDGEGRRYYKRNTYRHTLGRPLHPNNSGQMQWTPLGSRNSQYRDFHARTNAEVWRVLAPGGRFVLNIKNHYRTVGPKGNRRQEEQLVAEWHFTNLLDLGFMLEEKIAVPTPGLRHGQNHEVRVEHEYVAVFVKP